MRQIRPGRLSYVLGALILVQSACAVFFLTDVIGDYSVLGRAALRDHHLILEFVASVGLVLGIAFLAQYLLQVLRRQARAERGLGIASGALNDLMEQYFRDWGLTRAEQGVAAFTLKGYSIAEIAVLRETRGGTVKTHLNAIYRKAGVSGRGQLVSLLIEDLMAQPLIGGRDGQSAATADGWHRTKKPV